MATHSRILAWRIPWTGEPGGLQSMGSQRVRHDWSDLACNHRALVGNRKLVRWMEIDYYIESPGRFEESAENGQGQKKATQWDNSQNQSPTLALQELCHSLHRQCWCRFGKHFPGSWYGCLGNQNSLFFLSLSFLHITNSVLVHLTGQTYIKSSYSRCKRNGK